MPIKVKIDIKSIKPDSYPKLMIDNNRLLILFTCIGAGTVIDSGNTTHLIGDHSIHRNMDDFVDFKGDVTLSNKE